MPSPRWPCVLLLSLAACTHAGGPAAGPPHAIVAASALDRAPRCVSMPGVELPDSLRGATPATVRVTFVVDAAGTVCDAAVEDSTDPRFDGLALGLVQCWRFEPGLLEGRAVPCRMRVPVEFPAG